MGWFRGLLHYASLAWNAIFGAARDIESALIHLWNFTASVHTLLDHLFSRVARDMLSGYLQLVITLLHGIEDLGNAVWRIWPWLFRNHINPLRLWMLDRIRALRTWTAAQIRSLRALEFSLYYQSLRYALRLVTAERTQRIKDVMAARAYALQLVKAALSTVQQQAATGYADGNRQRVSAITKITDDLVNRNPAIRGLVGDFVRVLIDVIGTENPVERAVLQFLLTRVIDRLGVDRVAGDLLGKLIGPLAGNPHPKTLHDVVMNLAQRVSAIEEREADFMASGGPEIEQAGREWKAYTGLAVDAALLAFFGDAVADPAGWASMVAGTLGVAVDDSVASVAALIRRA